MGKKSRKKELLQNTPLYFAMALFKKEKHPYSVAFR